MTAARPVSASPGRATCGRASPVACWPAGRNRRRLPCGRRTCTAAAVSGSPPRSVRSDSWPESSRRRSRGRTPRSSPDACPAAQPEIAQLGVAPEAIGAVSRTGTTGAARGLAEEHARVTSDNYIAELPFGAPKIDDEAFVAPTAVVVGAVTMGPRSSIWYGAVARADHEIIEIGEGSNVQDGCMLHSDPGFPLLVGRGVTVGHSVVLHGARIDDDVLVGMGSIVMNGAHIGAGSIVAAGAVVTPNTTVPPRSVVAGVPAKLVRQATDDDLAHIHRNAESYYDRLPEARKVRPVVRRPLPPAGMVPGDALS